MRYSAIILFCAALLAGSFACFAVEPYAHALRATEAFSMWAPGQSLNGLPLAFGDLNGDGIVDFATLVPGPSQAGTGGSINRLVVFQGKRDGSFGYLDSTADITKLPGVFQEVSIESQTLVLHLDGEEGCCTRWVERFQFKSHKKDKLALIGLKTSVFYGASLNKQNEGNVIDLAAGKAERWVGNSARPDKQKFVVNGLAVIPLRDFHYSDFKSKWRVLWDSLKS